MSVFGCAFLTGVGLLNQGMDSALVPYLCFVAAITNYKKYSEWLKERMYHLTGLWLTSPGWHEQSVLQVHGAGTKSQLAGSCGTGARSDWCSLNPVGLFKE